MTPCSFPQVINRPNNQYSKGFAPVLGYFKGFGVLKAVENPILKVYNS